MEVAPARRDLDDKHELRVHIPIRLHLELDRRALLEGRRKAELVATALESYFARG